LSEDGSENKVLFLDSGGLECTVDPKLPMPIRGLRERAYNACNVVYENHFPKSDFTKFLPKGHVALSNVMFAPLIISNKAVGVMGLANKPTDFTDVDAKLAVAFGEFAAIALNNSYSADAIQKRDDEITKALERLSESNLKLENATEKLQVIGSLTRHDARNKLAVLNNYIYLLRKKIVDNTDANKFLTAMDEATKQLLAILEFEKVYEQIGSEILVYANVEKLFAEASLLITDFKGIKLECKCNGLEVLTDSLLRQLLYNLMDNTLKYGEKTTLIRLSCRKDENSMLLIYEDDGVGMSDEVRFHLFEKGFGKGTGFGLYMAKRIIEDYGWSIKENGKFGVGAKFTIKIPENKFRLKEST